MDKILDKSIVLVCCLAALFFEPFSTAFVVGLLFALIVTSLQEIAQIPVKIRLIVLGAYLVVALIVPVFVVFVPLMAYDCVRSENWAVKLSWIVPFMFAISRLSPVALVFLGVFALVSCVLATRTQRIEVEGVAHNALRDELRELSLSLEDRNRDLQDKQDYEVMLATLAERGRIAREIHDNVGHLLTRSTLQIKALQVVHTDDPQMKTELDQVGSTIQEAFDTVRESVHGLHDEAFDLEVSLQTIAREDVQIAIDLNYHAQIVPPQIGYSFVAIVREALSNVVKHTDADRVSITVVEYPAFYQLTIKDNGSRDPFTSVPLDDQTREPVSIDAFLQSSKWQGIGLRTMSERTRALGGIMRLAYDRGMKVFVSVPKTGAVVLSEDARADRGES